VKQKFGFFGHTGDPCLMRISLLRFFKVFHKYLPYAFFGLFISLVPFFGQKSSQKIAQTKYLGNANFSQNQKSHETRTLCNSFEREKTAFPL